MAFINDACSEGFFVFTVAGFHVEVVSQVLPHDQITKSQDTSNCGRSLYFESFRSSELTMLTTGATSHQLVAISKAIRKSGLHGIVWDGALSEQHPLYLT